MRIDIWSDVVCPWCYLGKRRLEIALADHPRRDEVEVYWHSYELDPGAPAGDDRPMTELIARKYGTTLEEAAAGQANLTALAAEVGLEYHLDRTRRANTFDAHRLLHLAREFGLQNELKEAMLAAYFCEGRPIGDPETLAEIAVGVGLDEEAVRAVLDSDEAYSEHVRHDEQAGVELGATGVPFFVFAGRYGLAGAQDPEVLRKVIDRAFAEV
ncbi:MAG: DsbA family oxidoreductase [Acidimicrobiales bacterium]